MARPVTPEVAYRALEGHDGWVVERHRLYRDFRLGSFTEAISLVDRVAEVAERAGHHPNILVHEWCFVHLELYSHRKPQRSRCGAGHRDRRDARRRQRFTRTSSR